MKTLESKPAARADRGGRAVAQAQAIHDLRQQAVRQRQQATLMRQSPQALQQQVLQAQLDQSPRRMAQRKAGLAMAQGTLQRQVALSKAAMTGDFVELTSIDYGLTIAGGPVELLKDSDFSGMAKKDALAIVAHGQPGKSGDYSAGEIAAALTDKKTGLTQAIKQITFTSCNAGKGTTEKNDDDSVVMVVKKALGDIGLDIPVKGARGPSIKSIGLDTLDYTVWDKTKTAKISSAVDKKTGTLSANTILETLLAYLMQPREKTREAIDKLKSSGDAQTDLAAKAQTAREVTTDFYKELVVMINDTGASHIKQALDNGDLVIDDKIGNAIGGKWGLPALTGAELTLAVKDALQHKNLLLEKAPMLVV